MNRRAFLSAVTGSLLTASLAAEAQQAGKVYRIGVLSSRRTPTYMTPFAKGLRELGWAEGRDFTLEYRFSGRDRHHRHRERSGGHARHH